MYEHNILEWEINIMVSRIFASLHVHEVFFRIGPNKNPNSKILNSYSFLSITNTPTYASQDGMNAEKFLDTTFWADF